MKHLLKVFFLNFIFIAAASAYQTPDPDCPLGYFYRGYDFIKGNPANDGADPGWRNSIMDQDFRKACLTCESYTACSAQYQVHDMDMEIDYQQSLYKKASLSQYSEDFFKTTSFTGSAEYYYQQQDVFGLGLVNVQAEGVCQLFEGARDLNCTTVKFTSGFTNAVAALPTSTADPDWVKKVHEFFGDYGTHLIGDYVSLGARWSFESQFTQANYDALRAGEVEIHAAAEASAEFERTKGASADYVSDEINEMRAEFNLAAYKQRALFIGAPPPADLSFGDWVNGIEHPVPQKYQLSPISELLTNNFFPNDPDIAAKRELMEAGYLLYCAAVDGCHTPKPPKIIQVNATEEGKYQTKNSLSVSCPVDYQLVSGGCKTDPLSSSTGWWMFSSLKPEGNTYHCNANMDYYTDPNFHHYYNGLSGSATCLHDDYIKDILIATCEGPEGKFGSECMAQCPIGYQVTGGGCGSNSTTSTWPWKVTRSAPIYHSDNEWSGWGCKAVEDSWSQTYYKKAQGYAVCVQYADGAVADKRIVTERSGTKNQFTNGAVAACSVGYEVLSGGCIVPTHSTPYEEWKIVETQHSLNQQAWSCLAQEDLFTHTYYQDVQTDALCVKFND